MGAILYRCCLIKTEKCYCREFPFLNKKFLLSTRLVNEVRIYVDVTTVNPQFIEGKPLSCIYFNFKFQSVCDVHL